MRAPRFTIRVPLVGLSPLMMVPASMVRVAPSSTYTNPLSRYWLLRVQLVLVVMLPDTVMAEAGVLVLYSQQQSLSASGS